MMTDLFSLPVREMHRPGQETSKAALEKTEKSRNTRTARVYDALRRFFPLGAIPEEIAYHTGDEMIDVRRCFSVLKKLGKIEATGELRKNGKDNDCQVWRVSAHDAVAAQNAVASRSTIY